LLIEKISIENINPAVYNPRKDLQPGDVEYEKLKKSISEFDIVEPLVWNKRSGNLVGGHQRLKILKELGYKEVEVSVVDLPDAKEKALNLALNKISGEWDFPLLKDILEEINTGEFDIEITGFDDKEIEDLMTKYYEPTDGLTDEDAIPEQVPTICKKGDLWQLGEHRLLCGDATVITDVERLMGGEKADMVFTDPPYGINLDSSYAGMPSDWASHKYDNKFQDKIIGDDKPYDASFLLTIFPCKEVYLFGADYYANTLPDSGIKGTWYIWDKREEANYDKMLGSPFEMIWGKQKHGKRIIRMRWASFYSSKNAEGEQPKSRVHPTQKPVALGKQFIDEHTKLADIVVDVYGGSGSTLIACEKLSRKCRMMEIDEHYCDVIIKRFEDFTGKKAELCLVE
jgi:DNA modification methylase